MIGSCMVEPALHAAAAAAGKGGAAANQAVSACSLLQLDAGDQQLAAAPV